MATGPPAVEGRAISWEDGSQQQHPGGRHDLPRAHQRHPARPQPWRRPEGGGRGRALRRFRRRHHRRGVEEAGKFERRCWRRSKGRRRAGIELDAGKVTTAPGWPDAYRRWTEGGWNAVSGRKHSAGLPLAINAACTEIWSAQHGVRPLPAADPVGDRSARCPWQRRTEKDLSGQAGCPANGPAPCSSRSRRPARVGALRTRAEKQAEGSYRIKGTKISSPMAITT